MAALGRAIFWAASAVATVLFPELIFKESRGGHGARIVRFSLTSVVVLGAVALEVLNWAGQSLLTVFAGPAYSGAARYLVWYGVGMILLGCVAVVVATHQSRGKRAFLTLLVPIALLEPDFIATFHHSIVQVIQVMDSPIVVLLTGLTAFLVVDQRRLRSTPGSAIDLAESEAPNLEPSRTGIHS